MSCCKSCEDGKECDGSKPGVPAGVIIPGPDPAVQPVIEAPAEESGTRRAPSWSGPAVAFSLEAGQSAQVASKLSLGQSEETASEAYELGDCNAIRVEIVIHNLTLASVDVQVEEGPELQNWRPASTARLSNAGYATWAVRGISSRFVRFRYTGSNTASGKATLAVNLLGVKGARRMASNFGAV